MKELKVRVQLNDDNKVLAIEPVNKVAGEAAETKIMTARLYTQSEIDREAEELMQEGCHVYKREHRRIHQIR